MSELDYNGMFEYLYGMKYGEKFNSEDYPNGIPKEEFESLIMEYLPITAEQIREYAVFDEENHTYVYQIKFKDKSGNEVASTKVVDFYLIDTETLEITDEKTNDWH